MVLMMVMVVEMSKGKCSPLHTPQHCADEVTLPLAARVAADWQYRRTLLSAVSSPRTPWGSSTCIGMVNTRLNSLLENKSRMKVITSLYNTV